MKKLESLLREKTDMIEELEVQRIHLEDHMIKIQSQLQSELDDTKRHN